MLSDAALALAAECDPKWLYNTARRTKRPLDRTIDSAFWWRLVHHLAKGVGLSVDDAVRAADALITMNPDTGRVKLVASRDESVAVSVDLARFHDSAALAVSSAIHRAVPKRRGRPLKRSRKRDEVSAASSVGVDILTRGSSDLERALSAMRQAPDSGPYTPQVVLEALADAGNAFVITGDLALVYHGKSRAVPAVDITAATMAASSSVLADTLNMLGARPRGVPVRDAFRLDSLLVRSAPALALRAGSVALNIAGSLPLAGEYQQLVDTAESVRLNGRSYLVASRLASPARRA